MLNQQSLKVEVNAGGGCLLPSDYKDYVDKR